MMYRMGRWLLACSGNGGADAWTKMQEENNALREGYAKHEQRRVENTRRLEEALQRYQTWETDLALVDGLMSQGQFKQAQEFCRVAFIKARRPATGRQYSQDQIAAMMAGQMQQAPSRGLAGLGSMGGLGSAFDQMFGDQRWR